MNEELRRHARALRGNFISNPTWSVFNLRHLITAHPLGGCPHGRRLPAGRRGCVRPRLRRRRHACTGAVRRRRFGDSERAGRESVPDDFRADASDSPSARSAQLRRRGVPAPARAVEHGGHRPRWTSIDYNEGQLEALFRRCPTLPIDTLVNPGGAPADRHGHADHPQRPLLERLLPARARAERHVVGDLHRASRRSFTSEDGQYTGITSDTDGRIRARNSLEEIEVEHGDGGTLEAGQVHPAALSGSAVAGLLRHFQDRSTRTC